MLNIGISDYNSFVYEASSMHGHGVWPLPVIVTAKIISSTDKKKAARQSDKKIIFREDYYDPISRVRRGRFYFSGQSQKIEWHVQPHPAIPLDMINPNSTGNGIPTVLETYYGQPFRNALPNQKLQNQLVLLGFDDRFTTWKVIDVEAIHTGEDLVTLKSINNFGILPTLLEEKIPREYLTKVQDALDKLLDEAHRSLPVSVIDRCRDAVSQILLAYYDLKDDSARDLSAAAKKLVKDKKMITANCAHTIAQLHSRAKPNEQEKRKLKSVTEENAQLAIKCVGTILCEIDWADWR